VSVVWFTCFAAGIRRVDGGILRCICRNGFGFVGGSMSFGFYRFVWSIGKRLLGQILNGRRMVKYATKKGGKKGNEEDACFAEKRKDCRFRAD